MTDLLIQGLTRELMQASRDGASYSELPRNYYNAEHELRSHTEQKAQEFNRCLYAALLTGFSPDYALITLPPSIKSLYPAELERMDRNLRDQSDEYFQSTNDPFIKDLAILLHRLIPCGAEYFYPFSGIPRSLLFRSGLPGFIRFIAAVASTGGLKPLLELHMHPEVTENFTPDGWLETYDNLADVLELNPQIRGIQSFSWFLDPALETISPHLTYLRQIPERCGAFIFYVGPENPITSGAVSKSEKRRQAAECGQYHPKTYARIWPRDRVVQRCWRSIQ